MKIKIKMKILKTYNIANILFWLMFVIKMRIKIKINLFYL
jgi:hypothetical protein